MKDTTNRKWETLQLKETGQTRTILGYKCKQFTFNTPKFNGEMWITQNLHNLPNDVGVFKASKMGKFYQKLSAKGFVLEITSITPKGKKTVMRTTRINNEQGYKVIIPEEFGTAINKIDYYAY